MELVLPGKWGTVSLSFRAAKTFESGGACGGCVCGNWVE